MKNAKPLQFMNSLRAEWRNLDTVDRCAFATIPAALIVAAIVIFTWKAGAVLLAVAILYGLVASRRPRRYPVAQLAVLTLPAFIDGPDAPLPDWIEFDRNGRPVIGLAEPAKPAPLPAIDWRAGCAEFHRAFTDWTVASVADRRRVTALEAENAKLRAKNSAVRLKLANLRGGKRAKLERMLKREEYRNSLIPIVHGRGGINPESHEFQTVYPSRKQAIDDGIPGYLLRRKGCALDTLAESLRADGYFTCPEDRHPGELLLEMLRSRAPSAAFTSTVPAELQFELRSLDDDESRFRGEDFAADDSFDVAAIESAGVA